MMNVYEIYAMKYDAKRECTMLYFIDGTHMEVSCKPKEFLENLCLLQGSSLQGRMDSFKYVLGVQKKIPVLVCLYRDVIFFPTQGNQSNECVWLQAKFVKKVSMRDTSNCIVYFEGGHHLHLAVGGRVIYKQLKRCKQYCSLITADVQASQIFDCNLCYTNKGDVYE